MRDANQPKVKATGRPSKIQLMSKSMAQGSEGVWRRWINRRGIAGYVCGLLAGQQQVLAGSPPARHHDQHTEQQSDAESCQHDQYQVCFPICAKEKIDSNNLLVIQRKSEEGKKNGCFEQPDQVFHF